MIRFEVYFVMIVSVLLAGWALLARHDERVAERVQQTIVQRSEKDGERRARKAEKAVVAARKPGAVDRLRSDPAACPDCR